MTMLDATTFITYPYLPDEMRSYTITPGDDDGAMTIARTTTSGRRSPRRSISTEFACCR